MFKMWSNDVSLESGLIILAPPLIMLQLRALSPLRNVSLPCLYTFSCDGTSQNRWTVVTSRACTRCTRCTRCVECSVSRHYLSVFLGAWKLPNADLQTCLKDWKLLLTSFNQTNSRSVHNVRFVLAAIGLTHRPRPRASCRTIHACSVMTSSQCAVYHWLLCYICQLMKMLYIL